MDSFNEKFWERMDRASDDAQKMVEEFRRLCVEPSSRVPVKGSRVIVAVGLLGMGHLWIREEGVVEEVGEASYKVRLVNYQPFQGEPGSRTVWVHSALITDVLTGE